MADDNDKRIEALVKLFEDSNSKSMEYFQGMTMGVASMVATVDSPEAAMGVVSALMRAAVVVAYSSVGTDRDALIRTCDDVAAIAAAHWDKASELNDKLVKVLVQVGLPIPEQLRTSADAVAEAKGDAKVSLMEGASCDCANCADLHTCEQPLAQAYREHNDIPFKSKHAKPPEPARPSMTVEQAIRSINTRRGGAA